MANSLVWESVNWRRGDDQFRFDIERGGLFATLSAPGGRSLTLPMVVWEGLLDAMKANRAARTRSEQQYPVRSRSRWYDGEIAEVADAYRSGKSIGEIAHAHNRSSYAIEHQLDKLGLISKASIYGPGPTTQATTQPRTQYGEPSGAQAEARPRSSRSTAQVAGGDVTGPNSAGPVNWPPDDIPWPTPRDCDASVVEGRG